MSFTLPTQEEKADYVQRQFDRIARKYDLTNDVISLGMHHSWKRRAVEQLGVKPGGVYLDVCCGTGDLSQRIAQVSDLTGRVVGLDFSANMLEVANQRISRRGSKVPVTFQAGDALNLPFEDATFDGAVISFGLRNLVSFQRGIEEMARVVKPGGIVVNLDLGKSKIPLFSQIFAMYFRHVVPVIGELLQSDKQAYTYLPESASTYPAPDGITNIFEKAGLKAVKYFPLALGTVALHKGMVPVSQSDIS